MSAYFAKGATLSEDGWFRYSLERVWSNTNEKRACWIMLNPSTADAAKDDPTIRKVVGFSQRFGCGGCSVVNVYPYRATSPADLRRAGYPNDATNNAHIRAAVTGSSVVIAAWGGHAQEMGVSRVTDILRERCGPARPCIALRIGKTGAPHHPLYVPYDVRPVPYLGPASKVVDLCDALRMSLEGGTP